VLCHPWWCHTHPRFMAAGMPAYFSYGPEISFRIENAQCYIN